MKNYVIAFLAICVVVALSFMFKNSQNPILDEFPMDHTLKTGNQNAKIMNSFQGSYCKTKCYLIY